MSRPAATMAALYTPLRVVGQGSFGRVVAARCNDSGNVVAIKCLSRRLVAERRQEANTRSEAMALSRIKSPFVVRHVESLSSSKALYIVTEYCPGGDLFTVIQRHGGALSEDMARFCLSAIAIGLQHSHEAGVLYRDLKPENVFVDEAGYPHLGDFGLCQTDMRTSDVLRGARGYCGTPEYAAPEVAMHHKTVSKEHRREYGFASDWWTFGILAYELMVGLPPFFNDPSRDARRPVAIQMDFRTLEFPSSLSPEAEGLIRSLLRTSTSRRLGSSEGAAEVLSHPFFGDSSMLVDSVRALAAKTVRSPIKHLVPPMSASGLPSPCSHESAVTRETASFDVTEMDTRARELARARLARGGAGSRAPSTQEFPPFVTLDRRTAGVTFGRRASSFVRR